MSNQDQTEKLAGGTYFLSDRGDGKVVEMEGKVEHSLSGKDGPRCEHSSPKKSGFNSAFISSMSNVAFNATISLDDTNNNGSNATSGNETAGSKPKSFLEAVSGSAPAVGSGACFTKSPHAEVFANNKQPGDPSVFYFFLTMKC